MDRQFYRDMQQQTESLEAALAEPEQEPVAYIRVSKSGNVTACAKIGDFYKLPEKTLLYTAPPRREWASLTDEERDLITDKVIGFNSCCGWEDDYARAIESRLKEKNT